MKRNARNFGNSILLIYIFMIIFTSCDPTYSDTDYLDIGQNYDYIKVYYNEADFIEQKNVNFSLIDRGYYSLSLDMINNQILFYRYSERSIYGHPQEIYIDARDKLGYSTWGDPKFEIQINSSEEIVGKSYEQIPLDSDNDGKTDSLLVHTAKFHDGLIKGGIQLKSPPAHLMLVLKSFNSEETNKTWKVASVFASNEEGVYEDASEDEDWKHYSDNLYTFHKTSKFEVNAGTMLSKDEADFFKGVSPNSTYGGYKYFGSYGVKEDEFKNQMLTLSVGGGVIKEKFTLTESDFSSMELYFENQKSTYLQKVKIIIIPQ